MGGDGTGSHGHTRTGIRRTGTFLRGALRTVLATGLLAVIAGCGGPAPTAAPSPAVAVVRGPVTQAGRWMLDGQGRVLLVHGVDVVAKDAPYYPAAFGFDDADAAWLAAQGLRLVRLGVLASGEMPTMGHIDGRYIDHLVATIDDLARHHVFTLLDWHQDDYGTFFDDPGTPYRADGFPAWMTVTGGARNVQSAFPDDYVTDPALQQAFQSFWDDAPVPGGQGLQAYALAMLRAVARRVAGNPWVLGYEVMNEPWPGTRWAPCVSAAGCPALDRTELDPYYRRAAAAIRAVDRRHLIFFEPFVTYNFGLAPTSVALPPDSGGVGLAFHEYAQSTAGYARVLALSRSWAASHDGALLATEWSVHGGDPASITRQADDLDAALMPWTYWVFDNCDIACSPASVANLLLDPRRPPAGANVNGPVADRVVRAYPVAVAGTPAAVSYDATSRVLRAAWTPTRAASTGSGAAFGPGADTVIATPRLLYPAGYRVTVRGGRVRSPAGAPTLVVAQVGRPPALSVTVTPR